MSKKSVALIAGVSGIIGVNLAKQLLGPNAARKWNKVYGVSRRDPGFLPKGLQHIPCDLQNKSDAQAKLGSLTDVTHVFCSIWLNVGSENDNVKVNEAIIANLLDGLGNSKLDHVALVTGGKHYIGPFESFDVNKPMLTPFKERLPRLPLPNFYYAQEDVVFDRAAKRNFTWSVARPSIVIGFAPTNQMNLGTIIAVYATLCKYTGKPFIFPGTPENLDIYFDCTDTQLLTDHLEWVVETPAAKNEAFNVVNGDIPRWRIMWPELARYFNLSTGDYPGKAIDMEKFMKDHEATWDEVVKKHGLKPYKLQELVQGWFANVMWSANETFFMDTCKVREAGFLKFQDTEKSFFNLFDVLRKENIIP